MKHNTGKNSDFSEQVVIASRLEVLAFIVPLSSVEGRTQVNSCCKLNKFNLIFGEFKFIVFLVFLTKRANLS